MKRRLTLLFTGLFFLAGSVLLWVVYLLVARALERQFVKVLSTGPVPGGRLPTPENADVLFRQIEVDVQHRADSVLQEVLRSSLIVMVGIGLIALVLGYLIADRALRPLERVTETAERLSESNLHERIALRGPKDEVKRLADTFDAMLDRLHRVFEGQRRFIGNASHELRTPLAVNRTVLEVALEEPGTSEDLKATARSLLGVNARYERLIEGLLLLAQSSQELDVRKPVSLEEVARMALEQVAVKRSVTVHRDLRDVVVEGDPLLLERLVYNLVENGVKYNVRDGHVWVRVREPGVVEVENTGPVVPAYEVEDLFEPFRRLHGDRVRSATGAGLGLSIVRAIVDAHGGTVAARPRPDGGLAVTVLLPEPP
ncbi:sensor histidine kinase [Thermoactinospora rubra]|uniref:sensor histidine kinase n=1 Tax=Thermoactinospora rubra TaxID=1088767 RepID=UPI000A116D06|nr:ATP-binding protein [Thermoactinospora rubra]